MKMAQNRLSVQDRKELDKYTKYLAIKIVQAIVQARLGEKTKTKSKPHSSGADWFNISIKDIPEVMEETRKSMAGQIPRVGLGMCVEVSLKTVEGDTMVLETWYLEITEQCDYSPRITNTVYSRMSMLLKSLISVTRVVPAYKVATLQGPDSFVICYRVYMGEPQTHCMGDNYRNVRVGQVGTPMGTLILSVVYRMHLAITPQKASNKDSQFMVKSDHFKPDMSPKHAQRPSHVAFHQENGSVVDELAAACQDIHPAANAPQNPGHVFTNGDRKPLSKHSKDNDNSPTCASDRQANFSERKPVAAFANGQSWQANMPDLSKFHVTECALDFLLPPWNETAKLDSLNQNCSSNSASNNNNRTNPVPNADNADTRSIASDTASQQSSSGASCADDFVLVELQVPFATANNGCPSAELGAFFRECQSAPELASFSDQPGLAEQIEDITSMLANFENSAPEFDDFVESLCQDETTI